MSNIYINEPATTGKVVINTTVGEIDIELWCKETPKACRNFIQLCLEGYYDNTIFHRVVKDFIVQGGDPSATGLGGESIYGEPFKDEFHSRLKFGRRGLVALANASKDANGSQFFFTMAATPELQNKHTIFGKVTGTTIFNMLKLQEGIVDQNERLEFPKKIISTEVLKNPFTDIVTRNIKKEEKKVENIIESKSKATKNFKLLSFGKEAEEEEDYIETIIKKQNLNQKSKSFYDLANNCLCVSKTKNDPTLFKKLKKNEENKLNEKNKKFTKNEIENKFDNYKINKQFIFNNEENFSDEDDKYSDQIKKMEKAKKEIESLKKEAFLNKKKSEKSKINNKEISASLLELQKTNDNYRNNYKKPTNRAEQSIKLMENFRKRLKEVKKNKKVNWKDSSSWMANKLKFEISEEENLVLAKDANLKDDDWYDIHDPRNVINKERRKVSSQIDNKI